jgi:hypothetical protein
MAPVASTRLLRLWPELEERTDMPDKKPPTNYRKSRRDQEKTTLILVILALVVVGTGLIGLIWGVEAALLGSGCLLGGAALITGLWFLLGLIQKFVGE